VTGVLEVRTTVDSEAAALALARRLVEARVAACVQVIGPLKSIYRWEGEIQEADEWLCAAKTTTAAYPSLEAAIVAAHPYEVPEVLALPVSLGSARYGAWVASEVRPDKSAG
jgi:periplasmic divalent cation tolerance protein